MMNDLQTIAFHITSVCENKCEYCYVGDIGRNEHPPYQNLERIINELARINIKNLILLGGDPCLYPQIEDVIRLGFHLGLKIDIISNTMDFNDYSITNLVNGFDVTILGPDATSHDKVTCVKGSYQHLLANIRKLVNERHKIGIILNATPQTYNKLFLTVKTLTEEGIPSTSIRYIMVQRIIPMGRASETLKYGLKKEYIRPLFEDLQKIEQTYDLEIVFEDAFPLCLVDKKFHKYLSPCLWGDTKASINWNGDVSRCGADFSFRLGNLFETPLEVIWRNSPTLRSFRANNWMPFECQNCPLVNKCRCGCPLSSLTTQDHEPDVLCPYSILN
jgi:radical SAM protein with 4Fe4S-binding SPASM domain